MMAEQSHTLFLTDVEVHSSGADINAPAKQCVLFSQGRKILAGRESRAGFSLLELLLVVAVGSVIILAGLGTYRLVMENLSTSQSVRQLVMLKQQVQQVFYGQATYRNENLLDDLAGLRALPSELGTAGTGNSMVARGQFGFISVEGKGESFTIGLTNVPKGACIRLAQTFTPLNTNDFVSLQVGSSTFSETADNMSQSTFMSACSDQSAQNTMTWTLR